MKILAVFLLLLCAWAAPAVGAQQAPDAKSHSVLIKGFKYQPDTLTVNVGDTVEWNNADIVPHTVTAADKSDKSFNSGTIAPGGSWKFLAKKAGTFNYGCTPHPNMKAKLVVQ